MIVDKEVSKLTRLTNLVRDKARELTELLSEPNKLQYEREYARQTREKL